MGVSLINNSRLICDSTAGGGVLFIYVFVCVCVSKTDCRCCVFGLCFTAVSDMSCCTLFIVVSGWKRALWSSQ